MGVPLGIGGTSSAPGLEPGPRAPKTLVLPITPRRTGPGDAVLVTCSARARHLPVATPRYDPGPRRAGRVGNSLPGRSRARRRACPSRPIRAGRGRGPHHPGAHLPDDARTGGRGPSGCGERPHGMMDPWPTPDAPPIPHDREPAARQLLAVSRRLFAERGSRDERRGDRRARRVSKPVVYEHFGGKEGIYAVVVDREVQALTAALSGALDEGGHPKVLLERTALALLSYIEASEDGFRILVRDSPSRRRRARSRASSATSRRRSSTSWRTSSARAASTRRSRPSTRRCSSAWSP